MNINIKSRPEIAYSVILHLILGYKQFGDDFSNKYPSLLADVVSYSGNPNCSCRSKIIKHIQDNFIDVTQWVDQWIESTPNNDQLDAVYNKIIGTAPEQIVPTYKPPEQTGGDPMPETTDMVGRIVIIPADADSYYLLLHEAFTKKWNYRGLTVSIKDDKWYIFFY